MLEHHYGRLGDCLGETEAVKTLGLLQTTDYDEIVKQSLAVGQYHAAQMSLPIEECDTIFFQYSEYAKFYEYDSWRPLAVEEVGSKVLFEDYQYRFIYTGKVDLIAEQGNIIAPWDHKTSMRRQILLWRLSISYRAPQ